MFETETLLGVLADPRERETTKDEAWRKLLSNPISSTTHWIDAELGPFSRTRTLSSACSSGANAIVVAASWLLLGECDIVLAGGADGLCRLTQAGFGALSACDPEPCRPFDVRRRGLNLGEGAGFVVLERAETARARGAVVACELGGWGIGSEAHHITNPDASGKTPARLLTRALERAGLGPTDLDYINAHGTATPLNDAMESAGIVAALGAEAARVPVSSSKGQLGPWPRRGPSRPSSRPSRSVTAWSRRPWGSSSPTRSAR
jgi:3-oxoacyl-[acyl-carrier-protein] synthase II